MNYNETGSLLHPDPATDAATPTEEVMNQARNQVRKLVEYLIEYSRLRTPPKLDVSDYEWHLTLSNLPYHSSVQFFQEPQEHDGERLLLRVGRPALTPCPTPPASLSSWIETGWERFESREAKLIELDTELDPDEDEDELSEEASEPRAYPEGVLQAFRDWNHSRQVWRVEEAPARKALQLFERMFQLKGTLEREGERWALTLGEGILRWRTQGGSPVDHPLISQRCSLTFDS